MINIFPTPASRFRLTLILFLAFSFNFVFFSLKEPYQAKALSPIHAQKILFFVWDSNYWADAKYSQISWGFQP